MLGWMVGIVGTTFSHLVIRFNLEGITHTATECAKSPNPYLACLFSKTGEILSTALQNIMNGTY